MLLILWLSATMWLTTPVNPEMTKHSSEPHGGKSARLLCLALKYVWRDMTCSSLVVFLCFYWGKIGASVPLALWLSLQMFSSFKSACNQFQVEGTRYMKTKVISGKRSLCPSWAAVQSVFVNAEATSLFPKILWTCLLSWQLQRTSDLEFTITWLLPVPRTLTVLCLNVLTKPQFAFDTLHGQRFSASPCSEETGTDRILKYPASIINLMAPPPPPPHRPPHRPPTLIFHSGRLFLSLPPTSPLPAVLQHLIKFNN